MLRVRVGFDISGSDRLRGLVAAERHVFKQHSAKLAGKRRARVGGGVTCLHLLKPPTPAPPQVHADVSDGNRRPDAPLNARLEEVSSFWGGKKCSHKRFLTATTRLDRLDLFHCY